jgi:hypothetical protein
MIFAISNAHYATPKKGSNRLAVLTMKVAVRVLRMTVRVAVCVAVRNAVGDFSFNLLNWNDFGNREIAWPA